MYKIFIVAVLCVAAGAYAYSSSKKVSEDSVHAFYKNDFDYTVQMNDAALCDEMSADFKGHSDQFGQDVARAEACDSSKKVFDAIRQVKEASNNDVAITYKVDITKIELDRDEHTATVEVAYTFNTLPVIKSMGTRTDVLQKIDGRLQLVSSVDHGEVHFGSH